MRMRKAICIICILVTFGLFVAITHDKNDTKEPVIYVYDQLVLSSDGM